MSSSSGNRSSGLIFAAPVAAIVGLIALVMAVAALGGSEAGGCGGSETVGALSSEVPAKLASLYENAAAKYHLGARGPSVLAAINFVETSFGTNMATSSAGAEGWMAFLPSTFAEWGVDGNGDGVEDIFNAADAIFSAANYLHDSGAPGDWWNAVFAYNHADWYVEKVLRYATQFATGSEEVTVAAASCEAIAAPDEAVARMVAEAERLSLLRPSDEYVWGGSHGESPTPANGPFDCSSAVSHLLQVGGFGIETTDTVGLSTWGEPGPGQWVTIWVKPVYNHGEAHTFIEFMPGVTSAEHRYWGTSGFVEPGHGPGWIPEPTFDADYLQYFEQRHPKGM
ncbi:MAG: Lytic transglycosylase catalytic [Solirubrobacterales bacterium]|nr:Lytic transglycosylase catalytic [Solirubrobacterales bacterium]